MIKWLLVAPIFDSVTEITYDESRDALEYLKDKVEVVGDLSGRPVKRSEVESALESDPEVNLAFWDHGSPDKLWGSEEEAVIDLENVEILSGREVFASACSFGEKGGAEAYRRKAKAVLCYDDIVYFTTDALAEFKEAFNFPIKRRADSLGWKECLEKTKQRMTELIDHLVEAGKALAASCLTWDRDHLHCWGEGIEEPPEECPVSRFIARVFGERVLSGLRRVRDSLVLMISIYD